MRTIKFRVWDDQRKQFRDDAISFQERKLNQSLKIVFFSINDLREF